MLEEKYRELQEKDRELLGKDRELLGKDRELQEKDQELKEKDRELKEKDREVKEKDRELKEKEKEGDARKLQLKEMTIKLVLSKIEWKRDKIKLKLRRKVDALQRDLKVFHEKDGELYAWASAQLKKMTEELDRESSAATK